MPNYSGPLPKIGDPLEIHEAAARFAYPVRKGAMSYGECAEWLKLWAFRLWPDGDHDALAERACTTLVQAIEREGEL